jgi:ATP-dependent protease HslVU (ClpYQ) peptidase subunit
MTTIAWDGKTLAGDRQSNFGPLRATTTKVHRIEGRLVGGAGCSFKLREVHNWFWAGMPKDQYPKMDSGDIDLICIGPHGSIFLYSDSATPVLIEDKIFAVGSGRDYALAAMHLGQTAEQAVRVAAVFDPGTGPDVDVLHLHPSKNYPDD